MVLHRNHVYFLLTEKFPNSSRIRNLMSFSCFIIVVDMVAAAEAVEAVEARCATKGEVVSEIVEVLEVTAVILIPRPLLQHTCVNAWMAM